MSHRASPRGFVRPRLDFSRRFLRSLCLFPVLAIAATAAPRATEAELARARAWSAAKFAGTTAAPAPGGHLQVVEGKGALLKNARPGGPIQVGGKIHAHGLYAGPITRLAVHLPGPAAVFEATAGLDLTWWGRGDVSDHAVFSVEAAGREVGRSERVTVGEAGAPVRANLDGATDFTLVVTNPDKVPARGTAIWAGARVTLRDGRTLWLDELPVTPLAGGAAVEPPFSFKYAGRPSQEFLRDWPVERSTQTLDAQRTERRVTYRDPQTGLAVRVVAVEYQDFPTVEWTVHFENTGTKDTPVIEDIRALDARVERNGEGEFVLHHYQGSLTTPTDYRPFATTLAAGETKEFVSEGRPTSKELCYFNLEWPGAGVIVALGWPGQWAASFVRDDARGLRLQAGQGRTHFKLHPGETARSPLVALQFWDGDEVRAQNLWRRWMLAHNTPRPGGQPLKPVVWACYNSLHEDYAQIDEQKNFTMLDRYLAAGIKLDFWEMDAGWYVNNGRWPNTGTWKPDPKRFPQGLKPLLDFVHARGLKTHIWFEPERINRGTELWDQRPEWSLRCPEWEETAASPADRHRFLRDNRLLDLGNPEAYRWMVDMLDGFIKDGIDFYRTDFNIDPLPFWQAADARDPDRVGLTENKYCVGFLAYFDELVRRHPGILLDTCASGGRRNDLETLRRSIPVTRSDYFADPVGVQNITYGIASWIPVYGTGTVGADSYVNRSAWGPWPGFGWYIRENDPTAPALAKFAAECRSLTEYFFYGDYYPLTSYNTGNDVWMAWQFDRPEQGTGMIQAFRRAESPYETTVLRLRGLNPAATYEITNLDAAGATRKTGRELAEDGLRVTSPAAPAALIFTYRTVVAP